MIRSTLARNVRVGHKLQSSVRLSQRYHSHSHGNTTKEIDSSSTSSRCCHWFQPQTNGENIWQIDISTIKFGNGALRELGSDAEGLQLKRVAVFTDKNQRNLPHVQIALESLRSKCEVEVFDEVHVEPTDKSVQQAIKFAKSFPFDGFISIGGGSVMDTCKIANLYSTYPTQDFLEYVTSPLGKATKIPGKLKPHIACPTTCGTGSESTGIAIFDFTEMKMKTGIAQRPLRPTMAVIDPTVTHTLPPNVVAASAFDVLSHSCESYTARPFTSKPYPSHPSLRPMSQGSNPWSDSSCLRALSICGENIVEAVNNTEDFHAREQMMMAATLAGVAFGNAGCHIPHAMSYSVSGLIHDLHGLDSSDGYYPDGYPRSSGPMVPHGFSVILNAPSAFRWTSDACPERHLDAARYLGAPHELCDPKFSSLPEQPGDVLALRIEELMRQCHVPNGLSGVGYSKEHLGLLAGGAIKERRLLENAPKIPNEQELRSIYERSLRYW